MSAAYIMIVAGSISTTLSFIGLVGAIKVFLFTELIEKYYSLSTDVIGKLLPLRYLFSFFFQETKCLLLSYFILLFLMFVVLLVGGVIAYVFRHQVKSDIVSFS